MVFPSQGELCPHQSLHRLHGNDETEIEHDDPEPTRQTGRRPNPQLAGETRVEVYTEAEIETAAARTLADAQARAATGTARARETAIQARRAIGRPPLQISIHYL